jgi:hypothetical protein
MKNSPIRLKKEILQAVNIFDEIRRTVKNMNELEKKTSWKIFLTVHA